MIKEILRIVTALVFIASGFVKAVDPVGFSFKLEEYFSPAVFNMPFFEKYALPIAVAVVILELALGLFLLFKRWLRPTLAALIALCVFFAFLTFYSAFFNVVTDCGCFGDALKLTPWQSFWKDIVLLAALIALWFLYKKEFRASSKKNVKVAVVLGLLGAVFGWIMGQGMYSEPLIDFRDYKIGTDMNAEKQKMAINPSIYKTFYFLKNEKTGETIEVDQDTYIDNKSYWEPGSPWKIDEGKTSTKMVKEGYTSEIMKFNIEDAAGNNLTEEILKAPKAIIVFSYAPDKADPQILQSAEQKASVEKEALVVGVSTRTGTFSKIKDATMDGTAIKTIARSNPFVLTLQNGKITGKEPGKNFKK